MAEQDRLDRFVEETRAFVEMRPAPDVTAAVMHRIRDVDARPRKASRGWFGRFAHSIWAPRHIAFEIRPAYALFALAVIVLVASISTLRPLSQGTTVGAVDAADQKVLVQFRLQSIDATDVRLAGSFTNWRPEYELHESGPGMWTITLPLSPGVHDYAFIIDGKRWVTDPFAPAVQDGFGGSNSRLTLLAGGSDRRL